jgi:hypothetical protein
MTTVGARHYPQPRPSSIVLAEQSAGYCEHGGVPGSCPPCRTAVPLPVEQDSPKPPSPRPSRRRVPRIREDDDRPDSGQLW